MELILQVYRKESQRKTLTSLDREFWQNVREYVSGLEEDLQKESRRDPNSAKAALLRDELKKVLKRRDQIYQYRERKIVRLAASAASGASVNTGNLTPLEEESFKALLDVLEGGRNRAFGVEAHEEGAEEVAEEVVEEVRQPVKKPQRPKKAKAKKVLLRILEDVPPFMGLDVTYKLKKEDVVSLPKDVAQLLLKQGRAEEIRPKLDIGK